MAPARLLALVYATLLVLTVLVGAAAAEDAGQYKLRDEVFVVANTVRAAACPFSLPFLLG